MLKKPFEANSKLMKIETFSLSLLGKTGLSDRKSFRPVLISVKNWHTSFHKLIDKARLPGCALKKRMSFYHKRDKNHNEICADLRKRGLCVEDLSASGNGVADIITHNKKGQTVFIEIKFGKDARVKKSQLKFLGNWSGWCGFAETPDEAFLLATKPEEKALTYKQKQRVLEFYVRLKSQHVNYSTLKKELGL